MLEFDRIRLPCHPADQRAYARRITLGISGEQHFTFDGEVITSFLFRENCSDFRTDSFVDVCDFFGIDARADTSHRTYAAYQRV